MLNARNKEFFDVEIYNHIMDLKKADKNALNVINAIDSVNCDRLKKYYNKIEELCKLPVSKRYDTYKEPIKYLRIIIDEMKHILRTEKFQNKEFADTNFIYQHAIFRFVVLSLASEKYEYPELENDINILLTEKFNFYRTEALVLKGRLLKNANDLKGAKAIFSDALYTYNSPDGCAELAYMEMEQGNYERAIVLYNSLKSKNSELINYQKMTRINLSRIYVKQKKYNAAKKELFDLLELRSHYANIVNLELGKIYFMEENYDEARKCLMSLLDNSNNEFDVVSALTELAILEKSIANYDGALKYAMDAMKINPSNYTKLILAKVYMDAGEYDQGNKLLNELLTCGNKKDRILAANELLVNYYRNGYYDQAKKMLPILGESDKKLDQQTYDFYTFLLYYANEKTPEAVALAKKIHREKPGSPIVFNTIIRDEIINGRFDEVKALIEEAENNQELDDYNIWHFKALYYYYSNQRGYFYEYYQKLLNTDDPDLVEVLYYLGRELYHYDYDLGFKCFEKALQYDSPLHQSIMLYYTITYVPTNDKQYDFKINRIKTLLKDPAINNDALWHGRLNNSLIRTYLTMQDYKKSEAICLDVIANEKDQYFYYDAKLSLAIIKRVNGYYHESLALAKEAFDNNFYVKHALIQMIKSAYKLDPTMAHEMYEKTNVDIDMADVHYEFARILINEGKYDEAKATLEKAMNGKYFKPYLVERCSNLIKYIDDNHNDLNNPNDEAYELEFNIN